MDSFDDIPEQALAWHRAGQGAALATVIQTWGSAPRRVGAQLAISGKGQIAGSVSGGCVEGAVVVEALEALQDGTPRELEFGVSDDDAFAVGLACGGTIRVLVEPVGGALSEALLDDLVQARAARRAICYIADLETGNRSLSENGHEDRRRMDRSGFDDAAPRVFIGVHNPPLRLVVVGAVHIAQALVPMARLAGYDPVVIDPREAFASQDRFPGTRLMHDWPDEAVMALGLDSRTALVLLTHDPKLDDPAIEQGLSGACFYIGALGSTRTHAKRMARLEQAGFTPDQIGRIYGPIGLDIGASGPAEIAVSTLAQMTRVLRRGA
jgi:xanthine dehydrogenase accessory factor